MTLKKLLHNFNGHLHTVNAHRRLVRKYCFKLGIYRQGLMHDLSKYSPSEFIPGVKYYQDGHRSPNNAQREDEGVSKAWLHHKGRNKHHFEYWTDYNPETRMMTPVRMPKRYVIEMFCDRIAAGKIYKGDAYNDTCPLQYFNNGKARRNIEPETSRELEHLLTILAEKGEDKTFAYIRRARFLGKKL